METPNSTVEMTYNAMYQRVQKAVDGGPTTRFIYDHKRLLAETDENDTTTRSFTSGTAGANSEYGDLVSEYDAQSLEEVFPQYDAQWSTRELIGDGCDVVARFRNTAFGLASPASSPSWSDLSSAQWSVMSVEDWNHLPVMDSGGPFGFGGQSGYYFDPETNLYLLGGGGRGRYYDPQLARFQNADPTGIASGDANLYRYVANDPVNRRDPSGNQDDLIRHLNQPSSYRGTNCADCHPDPTNGSDSNFSDFFAKPNEEELAQQELERLIKRFSSGEKISDERIAQTLQEYPDVCRPVYPGSQVRVSSLATDAPFIKIKLENQIVLIKAETSLPYFLGQTGKITWGFAGIYEDGSDAEILQQFKEEVTAQEKQQNQELRKENSKLIPGVSAYYYVTQGDGDPIEVAVDEALNFLLIGGVVVRSVKGLNRLRVAAGTVEAIGAAYQTKKAIDAAGDGQNSEAARRGISALLFVLGSKLSFDEFSRGKRNLSDTRLKTNENVDKPSGTGNNASGRLAPKAGPKDISLGIRQQHGGMLEEFSERIGAPEMSRFKELGLYDEGVSGWGRAFMQTMNRTKAAGGRAHFDLTGLDIARAKAGNPASWQDSYTAFELRSILRRRDWFEMTDFYRNGTKLTPQEMIDLGIVPHNFTP